MEVLDGQLESFNFYTNIIFFRFVSGMVGQLIRNEVEIGATPLFMTADRVALIQYIARPSSARSRFLFRAPKLSYTDNVYVLPFDSFVWLCLVALVLFTAFMLALTVFVEWRMQSNQLQQVITLFYGDYNGQ